MNESLKPMLDKGYVEKNGSVVSTSRKVGQRLTIFPVNLNRADSRHLMKKLPSAYFRFQPTKRIRVKE